MSLELLAIDLGKRSFHLHAIDADGVIISRKVSRAKLVEAVQNLVPTTVAMEACASAHHWGRLFIAAGCKVRLINPRFVKPFVKGSKNDAADAEAIFEAAIRPTMRFVSVKSAGQQDVQLLHRARERLVRQRTALIIIRADCSPNMVLSCPRDPGASKRKRQRPLHRPICPTSPGEIFADLLSQLDDVNVRLKKLGARIVSICRSNAACRRLAVLPGIGPIIATALVAAVYDGRHFRSGREIAASKSRSRMRGEDGWQLGAGRFFEA
jgi:transposase